MCISDVSTSLCEFTEVDGGQTVGRDKLPWFAQSQGEKENWVPGLTLWDGKNNVALSDGVRADGNTS